MKEIKPAAARMRFQAFMFSVRNLPRDRTYQSTASRSLISAPRLPGAWEECLIHVFLASDFDSWAGCRGISCPRSQPGRGSAALPAWTNVAQIRQFSGSGSGRNNPIRLQGVITLVDTDHGLVVLQDATGPIGLRLDLAGLDLKTGQEVLLEAAASSPFFATLPEYPLHPLERTLLTRFECPTNCGDHYATRVRGYVYPPATGEYRFWIASDDSSELWLGTNASPESSRKIAVVEPNKWTVLHEWNRFPSQGSEPVFLKAGEKYYLEAVHEQGLFWNHLEVAWQGPGMARTIIEGGFLSPYLDALNADWITRHSAGLGTGVILREFWTNCFIKGAPDLSPTTLRIRAGARSTPRPDSDTGTLAHTDADPDRTAFDSGRRLSLGGSGGNGHICCPGWKHLEPRTQ